MAQSVIRVLLETACAKQFLIAAYCLMPDHLHMLAGGTSVLSDALEFVRVFKQRSGFQFRQSRQQALWELSYYDRVLRHGDSIIEIAGYICWNPVRRKLCQKPDEYPYSGSQSFAWMREVYLPPKS